MSDFDTTQPNIISVSKADVVDHIVVATGCNLAIDSNSVTQARGIPTVDSSSKQATENIDSTIALRGSLNNPEERTFPNSEAEKFYFPQSPEQVASLRRLFLEARFSRVHGRFIFPVIFLSEKYVCRASTLSIQVSYVAFITNKSIICVGGIYFEQLYGKNQTIFWVTFC